MSAHQPIEMIYDLGTFDIDRKLKLMPPVAGNHPNPNVKFHRCFIRNQITDNNGKQRLSELVVKTPMVFSFGVREQKDFSTNTPNGDFQLPLSLWDRTSPTDEEQQWTTKFMEIIHSLKDQLNQYNDHEAIVNNGYSITDMTLQDFVNGALSWGKMKNRKLIDPTNKRPILNGKLVFSNKDGIRKCETKFYDIVTGLPLDYTTLVDKKLNVVCALKLDNIHVSRSFQSLQVKVMEVNVEVITDKSPNLLEAFRCNSSVETSSSLCTTITGHIQEPDQSDKSESQEQELESEEQVQEEEVESEEQVQEVESEEQEVESEEQEQEVEPEEQHALDLAKVPKKRGRKVIPK